MDHIRPTAIAIPLETWITQRGNILQHFLLRMQAVRAYPDARDRRIQLVRTLVFLIRRSVEILRGQ